MNSSRLTTSFAAGPGFVFPLLAALLAGGLLSACDPSGAALGRRGNDAYSDSLFADAARAYRSGLDALPDAERGAVRSGLWNNLGAARHQQENFQEARNAFREAIATAHTNTALARAHYNAGNTTFRQDSARQALRHYRNALLSNPSHEAAKFNYEFVKRNQPSKPPPQNEQNQQQEEDITPSPYAKKLKQQAEQLTAQRKYREAHRLMEQGTKVDRTVRAYRSFMKRLRDVADIDSDEASPMSPTPQNQSTSI